jgi:hypothetical protein
VRRLAWVSAGCGYLLEEEERQGVGRFSPVSEAADCRCFFGVSWHVVLIREAGCARVDWFILELVVNINAWQSCSCLYQLVVLNSNITDI